MQLRRCLIPLLLLLGVTACRVAAVALPQEVELPSFLAELQAELEADLAPTPENPLPVREVIMDKNKNPLEAEESGLWPYITHVTRTQIISTDSYCYRTRSKTVPIIGVTLPDNLGPKKEITEQCRRKRAIDTASIFGESAAAEVARAISPSAPKVDHSGEEEAAFVSPSQSENPRARKGRFMYLATSTKTETVYKITATTAVTFICTPKSSILNMCPGAGEPGQLNILGQLVDKKKEQIKGLLDQIKSLKDQVKSVGEGIPVIGDLKGQKPDKEEKDDMKPKDDKSR